jgi:hypothetical protein
MFKPNRFVPITAPTVTYATEPEPEPEPVYADEFPDAEPTVPERQTKRLPGEKLLKKLWKTQQKKQKQPDVAKLETSLRHLLREF